jgi:hypothetical protein
MDIESFISVQPRPAIQALSPFKPSSYLPDETDNLRRLNVGLVQMSYDGRFGERRIGAIKYERWNRQPLMIEPDSSVTEAIGTFLRELLELRFPRWEHAEGARGYFEWHVDDDSLAQHHALRIIEYRTVTIDND